MEPPPIVVVDGFGLGFLSRSPLLAGRPATQLPSPPPCARLHADAIAATYEHPRAVLCWGPGFLVAAELVRRHPHLVRGLVVVGGRVGPMHPSTDLGLLTALFRDYPRRAADLLRRAEALLGTCVADVLPDIRCPSLWLLGRDDPGAWRKRGRSAALACGASLAWTEGTSEAAVRRPDARVEAHLAALERSSVDDARPT